MKGARVNEVQYDVIVVGGGHAGAWAAVAEARLGARVAMVTSALETSVSPADLQNLVLEIERSRAS